jgi:hypothetical protein
MIQNPHDGAITTEAEFEAALTEIVAAAEDNGVAIEGGWTCNGRDGTLWDVVVTEVSPPDD